MEIIGIIRGVFSNRVVRRGCGGNHIFAPPLGFEKVFGKSRSPVSPLYHNFFQFPSFFFGSRKRGQYPFFPSPEYASGHYNWKDDLTNICVQTTIASVMGLMGSLFFGVGKGSGCLFGKKRERERKRKWERDRREGESEKIESERKSEEEQNLLP